MHLYLRLTFNNQWVDSTCTSLLELLVVTEQQDNNNSIASNGSKSSKNSRVGVSGGVASPITSETKEVPFDIHVDSVVIYPVPYLEDNYAYLVVNEKTKRAVAVDPAHHAVLLVGFIINNYDIMVHVGCLGEVWYYTSRSFSDT